MKHASLTRAWAATAFVFAGLFGWHTGQAFSDNPVTYRQDMLCGAAALRPDRDAALLEQVLRTPAGSIGYYRFGHGSPIVLITGYRASMAEWNAYFLGELAKNHEVIIFDNRGVGRSQIRGTNYGIEDLARDTATLIKDLRLKDATVLGWSMGGAIAQQLAIDEPALVKRLVLMSSAPPGQPGAAVSASASRALSGSGQGHFQRVMDILFPPAAQQQAIRCFVGDMFRPAGYAAPISNEVTIAQGKILQEWTQDDMALRQLSHLTLPVLVLAGVDDEVVAPSNALAFGRIFPQAVLVDVAAGGHAMMYQYPRSLAERIGDFIAQQP